MASRGAEMSRVPHACQTCKQQKRRCDKRFPQCSLCLRLLRHCDYSRSASSSNDQCQALQLRVSELEALLVQKDELLKQRTSFTLQTSHNHDPPVRLVNASHSEQFPSLFFLDHEMFREARITIPRPIPLVTEDNYYVLGDSNQLRKIADRFFTTIHTWFPVLSRKRLQLMLADPGFELSSAIALLFSAMHLVMDEGSDPNRSSKLYRSTKDHATALEANAGMTPHLLQANVLIALYEIGHAMYPAAYLSVGKCVTLGKAFGLDDRKHASQMLPRYGAWAELEGLRRLWWAILLLDRYIHVGQSGHALASEDPHWNEVLPADDTQFDQAEMAGSEPLYVASPTNLKAGPFARTCQAANLLGKVLVLLNDFLHETETRFTTALQMHRTLTAFVKVVQEDFSKSPEQYATAMALAYSALMALCDPFCCTETNKGAHTVEETELQIICITGIKTVADDVARFAQKLQLSMITNPAAISPLIGNCLYMGTITFAWRVYEGEHLGTIDAYRLLRSTLSTLSGRWAVGGGYLQGIDIARELLYSTPLL